MSSFPAPHSPVRILALAAALALAGVAQATTVLPAITHGDIQIGLVPVATGLSAPDYAT